ncbi:polysaccharide deacetylase family protein [Mesorhizobium sp. B2-1-5]|uniref:polysaccharide deacetylase family protein n=1 Tax=Mesorhizobium sp. B2-1-5 TaxID=2589969 RepID=UPI001126B080|nr:polysaccharide deacetylase family protein [Mesorhizobium sp. B2-1-5]TPM98529.1 polysaccharide deacetylase [Mesorhizobium sp. B2-1-5]
MPLSPRERIDYQAIVDRQPLKLPDGVRMPVWLIVNVEHWDARRPMPRTVLPPPMGMPMLPDIPNWSWHEYGMRVGFWRIHESLTSRTIVPTLAINGSVCEVYPKIAHAAHDAGWELMGHGWLQGPMHNLEDQRVAIRRTIGALSKISGKPPVGWESPGLTETSDTADILAEEGIRYVADWVMDDLPCELKTTAGRLVTLPYTVEINDVAIMAVAQHSSAELLERGKRQFDRLYRESATSPRIMSISVHPYLSGVPHRIGYLEELLDYISSHRDVAFWTGEQIYNWYTFARLPAGSVELSGTAMG